jgi:hypothetical protein
LERDALARGIAVNLDAIRSTPGALKFVTRLKRSMSASTSVPVAAPPSVPPAGPVVRENAVATKGEPRWPSHVLYRGRARAIGSRLNVGRTTFPEATRADALPERIALIEQATDGVWARPDSAGLTLNGKPLTEATRLRIGDALGLGDHEFVLIRVMDGEAS